MICAPSKDSDHPSLISLCYPPEKKFGSFDSQKVHNEGFDQTGQRLRIIWVFAGCIGHFDGFVMLASTKVMDEYMYDSELL